MNGGNVITSCNNQLVVRLAKLSDPKFRRSEGLFLCEGEKLTRDALGCGACPRYLLVLESESEKFSELCGKARRMGAEVIFLSPSPFGKISTEKSPQGVIAVLDSADFCKPFTEGTDERIFMCDGVRDPGNLGTIIRTAAATGFDTAVLSDCADVLSPKTVRASMGGIFRINVRISADMAETVRLLRSAGRRVFAAALGENSKCLGRFELRADDVFLVGNEGHGLSDELISSCTESVLIEMVGDTDSLNVSCASTILMWEMSKVFNGISVRSVTDHG